MAVEPIAVLHAERQVTLARRTASELAQLWALIDPSRIAQSWTALLPQALAALGTSQTTAAASAGIYIDDVLEASGIPVDPVDRIAPGAFAGIASDGRPLGSLLLEPVINSLSLIKRGAAVPQALTSGRFQLDMITRTQIADAGRTAVGVGIAARPQVRGYVRVLVGKSCNRCVILAGRRYEWNAGFRRHPRCDCRHVPIGEEIPDDIRTDPRAYFDSLSTVEQDEIFTKAGARSIREGSDMARVVNARRGTYEAGGLSLTTEATTRRGINRRVRLMPEEIYRIAGSDRAEAVRLLRVHGYLTGGVPRVADVMPTPVRLPVTRPARPVRPPAAAPTALPVPAPVTARAAAVDRLDQLAANLDADRAAFAARVARANDAHYDLHLAEIGARQGMDGQPRVGTRDEVDAAVAAGWTEGWRGVVAAGDITPAQINATLRTGPYQPGRGIYGNGWYLSERRMSAETYREREPKTNYPAGGGPDFEPSDLEGPEEFDSLVRVALDPAARVVDYDELLAEHGRWVASRPSGSPSADTFADVGRYAAARGYDVIRVDGDHPDGAFYPGWEDAEDDMGGAVQHVVLNRAVMLIQRAEEAP